MSRRRSLLVAMAVAVVFASIAAPSAAATPNVLTVGGPATPGTIPPGFLGLSLEYFAILPYAGTNPSAVDPVFLQLIRNLSPGQAPDPQDRRRHDRPDLVAGPRHAHPGRRHRHVDAQLDRGHPRARRQARSAIDARDQLRGRQHKGRRRRGERRGRPDRFKTDRGARARQRARAVSVVRLGALRRSRASARVRLPAFSEDFTRIARSLPHVPLAGPTDGGTRWFPKVGTFLADHPQVAVATIHRYPLEGCYVQPSEPSYPTIPHMLSAASTSALAHSVTPAVRQAHARHVPIRVDEINTISCGWDPAVEQIVRLRPVGARHAVRARPCRRRRRQHPHVPRGDLRAVPVRPRRRAMARRRHARVLRPRHVRSGRTRRVAAAEGLADGCRCAPDPRVCDASRRRHDPGRGDQRGLERPDPPRAAAGGVRGAGDGRTARGASASALASA